MYLRWRLPLLFKNLIDPNPFTPNRPINKLPLHQHPQRRRRILPATRIRRDADISLTAGADGADAAETTVGTGSTAR